MAQCVNLYFREFSGALRRLDAMNQPPTPYIFFTGFPGFVGSRLLRRLLEDEPHAHFRLLVEERRMDQARQALRSILLEFSEEGVRPEQLELLEGDLTLDHLGLSETIRARLRREITRIYHLACVDDVIISRDLGLRVNVVGTRRVLDLAREIEGLRRLVYFSTTFVSGRRRGLIMEYELDEGQRFKNHAEYTKFCAEMEVQRELESLPIIVIRPSIVVGDHVTGETDKPDLLYRLIGFLHTLKGMRRTVRGPLMRLLRQYIGRGDAPFNAVPIDFLIEAVMHISAQPTSIGKVFQVVDPDPPPARAVFSALREEMGIRDVRFGLPAWTGELALRAPILSDWLDLPYQVLAYLNHNAKYDNAATRKALEGSELRCPPLLDYLPPIVEFAAKDHLARPLRLDLEDTAAIG